MNQYAILNNELVSLENIQTINLNEKESLINISYWINDKPLYYAVDYTDCKIDPNEKTTPIQRDYEMLKVALTRGLKAITLKEDIEKVLKSTRKDKLREIRRIINNV